MKTKALNKLQENLRKDFIMKELIHNTRKSKPYVDTTMATVFWGDDVNDLKEKKSDAKVSKA